MLREVTVTVPATTANLGPGFDCLGLALSLHNQVTLSETAGGLKVVVHGEGEDAIPGDDSNLVVQAAERLFQQVGRRPTGLRIVQENRIPVSSGLGSSAAAVVGGVVAADALVDSRLGTEALLALAAEMEGHPDNVAPAMYGGLTLINRADNGLVVEQIRPPHMSVVVVLPEFHLPTAEARAALPELVPLADAVFNAGRVGLLVRALETGEYEKLNIATQDHLHQPYRIPLVPGAAEAFAAGRAAGASAVALSGAGPAVVALAPDGHAAIAKAMVGAFEKARLPGRSWTLTVDRQGCIIR